MPEFRFSIGSPGSDEFKPDCQMGKSGPRRLQDEFEDDENRLPNDAESRIILPLDSNRVNEGGLRHAFVPVEDGRDEFMDTSDDQMRCSPKKKLSF